MSTIKKEKIKNNMTARFQSITTENEYYSNLGSNVYFDRSPDAKIPENKLPALNFRFVDDEPFQEVTPTFGFHTLLQDAEIDIIGSADSNMFELEADVIKAIGTDLTWTGLAITTARGSSVCEPIDHQGIKVADRRLNISIKYRTKAWSEN